ncbi:ribosomal-processing cysteine protease Prp [Scatolibacter rhodanostii]|uniref:ribosomal-processing cysteine protease Prp n=1 Tax=Scatolibacter rhodanostii TaxID=2014781 RepID=UPI000C084B12|nr:ribosomal-processing cysteine protease Prp [Scatolibacter rhodanostii]
MIDVNFFVLPDGKIEGFGITGHSDYAEEGSDIVCAAVSSAAFMAVNTITDVLLTTPKQLRAQDGDMFFRIEIKDIPMCRIVMEGLKNHLLSLEEQYDDYIRVSYVEV